jgi:hypothetical protein
MDPADVASYREHMRWQALAENPNHKMNWKAFGLFCDKQLELDKEKLQLDKA